MAKSQKSQSPMLDKLIQQHPLQRLQSPSRSASAALHVLGLASFAKSFVYLATHPNRINTAYGWHFQYLTIIGLTLSTLTFTSGILSDMTLSRPLFTLKNVLSICSTPLALLISLLYWGLRAVDPALVVPADLGLPLDEDIGFHAAPIILLLIDLLFFSPPWTITVAPALALSTAIAFAYWYWIELCFQHNGFYPYPLFEILGTGQRVALFGGSAVVMAASTIVLQWVYRQVNGSRARPGSVKAL